MSFKYYLNNIRVLPQNKDMKDKATYKVVGKLIRSVFYPTVGTIVRKEGDYTSDSGSELLIPRKFRHTQRGKGG